MTENDSIQKALKFPRGARFYKCALQINPFDYLIKYKKATPFTDEETYNNALIQACKEQGVEVIAVTDHYCVKSTARLIAAARHNGILVFPGFEAVTKDGIHLLCLCDANRNASELERIIGDCGIHDQQTGMPLGDYDVLELLQRSRIKWNAVCVAAHVASDGGLLRTLAGQARINAWRSQDLLACSLPGPIEEAPDDLRPILQNKNADYRREHAVAVINAQDINGPDDLVKPGASCWIKMSEVSVDGLRQAFLDPESRIRLASDPVPEEHIELVAIVWQGGFLDGQAIHFNENLNVLIGGRGTGKSTIVESLRYVLGLSPLGEEARKAHEGIIRQVLRSGTKISLLVRSYRPSKREYLLERTVPNPPVVREEKGQVLNIMPQDIIPKAEVYGQHEISELTKSPEKLTRLLERFVEKDPDLAGHKIELKRELERSRSRIIEVLKEMKQIEERLAALPGLEETLKRFQKAGLEDRLKEQSLLVREERVLKTVPERIVPFKELLEKLRHEIPIDRAFLSPKALENLPNKDIFTEINAVLQRFNDELEAIAKQIAEAIDRTDKGIAALRQRWEERKLVVQSAYEKILRELQKSSVDGEEFIRLRRQIEELRPLKDRKVALQQTLIELDQLRRNHLAEWEDIKGAEFRQLERAAKKVSRQLSDRVRVQVAFAGNREPLFALLRDQVGGRLSEAIEVLRSRDTLSLKELTEAIREGREAVHQKFSIPLAQTDRLTAAPPEVIMHIEELDLPPTTKIELNVAGEGQPAVWQALDDLSTGQKATAVLLLLLLESDAPLVVDQPEDDLDNRFITEGVVPKMRQEKRRRQFIFATHNANIPVLGDSELIVGLMASGEAGQGHAEISDEHLGSIDTRTVRELVEDVLEGGKAAFEMRRLKYGF
jgi:DNA repair ATPase RecN